MVGLHLFSSYDLIGFDFIMFLNELKGMCQSDSVGCITCFDEHNQSVKNRLK